MLSGYLNICHLFCVQSVYPKEGEACDA